MNEITRTSKKKKKRDQKTFLSDALTKIFDNTAMVSVAVTNLHRYHAVVVR